MQTHRGSQVLERFGKEVSRAHPKFQRSEGVFNGLSTGCHGVRHTIKPCLHVIEHAFMNPAPDLFDVITCAWAIGCALGLEFAAQTRSQIAVSVKVVVLAVPPHRSFGENLAGRASVMIVLGVVDKVISAKKAAIGIVRGLGLGHTRQNAGSFASQHLFAVVVAAVSKGLHRFGAKSRLGLLRHAEELAPVIDGIGDFVSNNEMVLGFHSTLNVVATVPVALPVPCIERASGSVSEI
jgi:hypothetical protein